LGILLAGETGMVIIKVITATTVMIVTKVIAFLQKMGGEINIALFGKEKKERL
jgi:hypothetical protein